MRFADPGKLRHAPSPRCLFRVARAVLGLAVVLPGSQAQPAQMASPRETITDAARIWSIPPELKTVAHPLRLEGRVSYYDPSWKLCWIEQNQVGTYLLLGAVPPPMRIGQRVRIEGSIVPDKGLSADLARVTVLQEFEPIEPIAPQAFIGDMAAYGGRVVKVDAFVDGQQYVDDDHVRLALIVHDRPVIGWVKPVNPHQIPKWQGKFIQLQGVYSARFTPTNTETTIEIWAGSAENLTVVASADTHVLFDRPRTPINELFRTPLGTQVLVRGVVEAHDAGELITIRDQTGQVAVHSIQHERIPFGVEVEAVGAVALAGPRWVLRSALYRRAASSEAADASANAAALESVEQVRQLSLDEASRGRPVKLAGMVTWSMPGTDFFFLQDLTGGVRVRYDRAAMETPSLGKYLEVQGVTGAGPSVPLVQLQRAVDLGAMSPPAPKSVTFEQALTGREDGQWVEMRGFIQRTESEGDWRWIYVTTPAGEFVGHLQSPVNFVANPGSLIEVHGVCEATPDATGQLTGVMLRVPFLHSITTQEDAPVDYYDLPLRAVKDLRQLSGVRDMMRVRVAGTVLHAVPGRFAYLQDGDSGLLLLTRQTVAVTPGDKIEAVGILGWEGARTVLREAVLRKTGTGAPAGPVTVAEPGRLQPALDSRLVTLRGTLIDASRQLGRVRLTLQSGPTVFEALRDHGTAATKDLPPSGAGLELTGSYRVGFD
ncbi:MAG TPA: hypothetical protein VEQ65_10000, partial [Opitutus sp.]|nr:hypothetical protein [Opitutus sp.]